MTLLTAIDPALPLHAVAIFCVIMSFLAFHWGYSKKDRAITRQHRQAFEEAQAKMPRAVRAEKPVTAGLWRSYTKKISH